MTKKIFLINVIAFLSAWLALPFLLACDTGCFEYEGNCACDQKPEQLKPSEEIKPSDEVPPRSGMPAYQAENIKADMSSSVAAQDAKADQEKQEADLQGKKAAGL